MKIYREHVATFVVVLCAIALLLTMVSYLDTQTNRTTVSNVDQQTLRSREMSSSRLNYNEGAAIVNIVIEYTTDGEFDVWLVDDEGFDLSDSLFGIDPWLRHGIAGTGDIEWSVSADEFEGNLLLVEENTGIGERGSSFNGTTINYDYRITTRSIEDPMENGFTWALLAIIVLAIVLLALEIFLPRKEVMDFRKLYPDFPNSMRTNDDGPP